MLDPYLVLGVGKYDDDQTVKKAYRQLSKQYHPDNNLNNPNKDAAEETFKRIQQAYEQIMHERSLGIGGPNDLRRERQEERTASSGNSQSTYGQWGSTRTAEKERNTNTSGFWNNSAFNENANNNNNNAYNTYNNANNNNNNNFWNNTGGYYSGGNQGYQGNGGAGGNGGYYSGYRQNNNRSSFSSGSSNYYYGNEQENVDGILNNVAEKLNSRNFFEAWDILNSMQQRNDVWYYYSAIANLGLGNSITALSHARTAKAMCPRPEYDEFINGIQNGTLHYQGRSDMFVPQKANGKNTCVKVAVAMVFINIFCSSGSVVFNRFVCPC